MALKAPIGRAASSVWPSAFHLGCCCIAGTSQGGCQNHKCPPGWWPAIVFATFFVPVKTPFYDLAVVGLLYPSLIVIALANEPHGEISTRLFDFAGLISYPLYVLHWPLAHFLRVATADSVGLGAGLGYLVVAALLAYLAARFYDTPVRAWLRSRNAAPPSSALTKNEENPVSALAERASSPL